MPVRYYFCLVTLLLSSMLSAQDITGLWKGTLYNDTTGQFYRYELAISEEKGKLTGYSHTWFILEDKQFYGVKKVKIKKQDEKYLVEDDELIANNYPVSPAKKVKQLNVLTLEIRDSVMFMSGPFSTNRTKEYRPLTGNINIQRKNDFWQSALVPHLQELGKANELSFVQEEAKQIAKKVSEENEAKVLLAKAEAEKTEKQKQQELLAIAEQEKKEKEKQDALIAKAEAQRLEKEKEEALAKAETERKEKEKQDALIAKEEAERKEKEKQDALIAKAEAERKEKEKKDALAKAVAERKEKEYYDALAKAEAQQKEKEKKDALAKAELQRLEKEKKDALVKAEAERKEKEKRDAIAKAESQRKEKERLDAIAKAEAERKEKEKQNALAKAEAERKELEKKLADSQALLAKKEEAAKNSNPGIIGAAHNVSKRYTELQQTVYFKSDSLQLSIFDNGEVDGDTVSILMNGNILFSKERLSTNAVRKTITIDRATDSIQFIMYAENLGTIAPNTGLLVVKDGKDIYEIRFSGDLKKNAAIMFRRKKP